MERNFAVKINYFTHFVLILMGINWQGVEASTWFLHFRLDVKE